MLACIEVLLRAYPAFRDVEFSTDAIMSFLGPSPSLSLREASSLGSIKLLDWIWTSSCTSIDTRVPQWTLANYLRSDSHYYRFQFSKGLEEAAGRGDLEVVKWLFTHFSGCEAPKTVVDAAASKGHLHVLEFLWAHSCSGTVKKKRKLVAADGVVLAERMAGKLTQRCGGDNVVLWEDGAMLCAVTNGHFHVVRWLCEFTPHDKLSSNYDQVIKHALRAGDDDLVRFLQPPGRCVLDYAAKCPRLDVIEWMLDCGYLRHDIESAACAIRDLAGTGRLDLMQQIALMHSPLPRYYAQWFTSDLWYDAIGKACECGGLATFQWLIEYPIQIRIQQVRRKLQYRRNPFVLAASAGQWRIVEYLMSAEDRGRD